MSRKPLYYFKRGKEYPNLTPNTIIGDGSCYLHCFLDALSKTYGELSTEEKSLMATKLRLDFANILLSTSKKSQYMISIRCNILSPQPISKFFKNTFIDKKTGLERNTRETLIQISEEYVDDFSDENIDETLLKISELGLRWTDAQIPETDYIKGEELTYDKLLEIFMRDYRLNYYCSDSIIYEVYGGQRSPIRKSDYGIDRIPINLVFFEIVKLPPISYDMFNRIFGILLSDRSLFPLYEQNEIIGTQYLSHEESNIFAKFLGINVVAIIHKGGYKEEQYYGEYKEGFPTIILINLNARERSAHWESLSLYNNKNTINKVMIGIDKSVYSDLHRILNS